MRRKAGGFSLIELMIVVGIVGILTSVAVPSYVRFSAKARRAEAKGQLASIQKCLRTYLAEHGRYTDDLKALEWAPTASPIYIYGFTSDTSGSGVNDSAELRAAGGRGFSTTKMVDAFGTPLTGTDLPDAQVDSLSFTVGAAGNIDADGALDKWTLDDDGRLDNVTDDLF